MNTKYQLLQESVILQEKLQMVEAFKDFMTWWNKKGPTGGEEFKKAAVESKNSYLTWGIITLSSLMLIGMAFVIFERFRKKHGDAEAKKHLISKLEKERTKLNMNPAIKGRYDNKIIMLQNKVETFI